jgi:predicted transcriptional regulator
MNADARRKVAEGLADLKAGRVVDSEKAVADILKRLRTRRDRRRRGRDNA